MDEEKADDMNNKIFEHRSEGGKSTSLLRKLTGWPTGRSEFTSLLQKLKDLVMGSSESPSLLQKVTGWFRGNLESNSSLQKSQGCLTEGSSDVSKGKTEVVYYNNVLPLEVLVKIFSYLSILDLRNVQCVCCNWRIAAHDKGLWKNYTLFISGTPEDHKNVKTMVALRNIEGYELENSFLNVILENVLELSKMNCSFNPPLTYNQVYSIFERYPKLESVTLDLSDPEILESIEIWKESKHLKEILFWCKSKDTICEDIPVCNLLNLFAVLNDSKSFPALKHLDLWILSYLTDFPYSEVRDVVINIIKQRSQHLSTLNIAVDNEVVDIVNAINMCTNLQFLTLLLKESCPYSIEIDKMTHLKHLSIRMHEDDPSFLTLLRDSFYKGSWPHLTDVDLGVRNTCPFKVHILSAVLWNVKQLETLSYSNYDQHTNDGELQDIGNLPKLRNVTLWGWRKVTEEGMIYLSHCDNLKSLDFHAFMCDVSDLRLFICRMIREMKKLEYFKFRIRGKFSITLESKEDIDRYIQLS